MWQDFVFMAGSVLSIVFLVPTLQDKSTRIPLGSSMPSMMIGSIYAFTYTTMGMTFSAAGSLGVATMWSLIVCYRAPGAHSGPRNMGRFFKDTFERGKRLVARSRGTDRHPQTGHTESAD